MDLDDEYVGLLRPLIDRFSDEELDRLTDGTGPRLYVLLGAASSSTRIRVAERGSGFSHHEPAQSSGVRPGGLRVWAG